MVEMKCEQCGFENKDNAKFCTKCGKPLVQKVAPAVPKESNNIKYIVIALVVVILILVGVLGFSVYNMNSDHIQTNNASQNDSAQSPQSDDSSNEKTQEVSSSQSESSSTHVVDSKSWKSIGSYSGSGSGSQTISVPPGKILVKLSAFPIKNYATNHLYVSGSNGVSGGVDWGSHSDVETRSDSFEYTSSNEETFTIDYYETVSWEVEFFKYQ